MGPHGSQPRSYGNKLGWVQRLVAVLAVVAWALGPALATARTVKIVVLGDSLTAGLGLAESATFPARLARALSADGGRAMDTARSAR